MAVVSDVVFFDHCARGGMRRDISGPALAHHAASIAQGIAARITARSAKIGKRPNCRPLWRFISSKR
jgi:hypothetical protein